MPDPLCRVHSISVLLGGDERRDDSAARLIPPGEMGALRVALGRTVRQVRVVRGISQETLGFAGELHRNYVGVIERGEINLTLRVLYNVAHGLRVPASDLLIVAERLVAERLLIERRRAKRAEHR